MAGFEDLGQAFAGNESGNALSYAKGLSLGANTQNALAEARARVTKNTALDKLGSVMAGFGVTDPAQGAAYATAGQAGIDPTQFLNARLKQSEAGTRERIASDPSVDDTLAQRLLLSLANGPVKPFESVGEGQQQNILHPEQGVSTTPLGQALIGQRDASAALDNEKRLHPERFASAGSPFLVTPGGVFTKTPPAAPGAAPTLAPTLGADGKPIDYAKAVGDVAGARTSATTTAKLQATNRAALPGKLNDIASFTTNLDSLLAQPGFDSIYGNLQGTGVGQTITTALSQDAANASAAREQLGSQAFSVAIQKMRGLGQLSNAEGLKVQSALTRMTNPRISPEEARRAAEELKVQLGALEKVARQEAGDSAVDSIMNVAPSFASEAEAEAAGLQHNTKVIIGGVAGTWQ